MTTSQARNPRGAPDVPNATGAPGGPGGAADGAGEASSGADQPRPGELRTPPRPPRIIRPGSGRVFAGVCAGIAEHLALPVTWVRWFVVIASLFGGAGVLAYGLLWVFTPVEDKASTAAAGAGAAGAGSGAESGDESAEQGHRRSDALRLVVLGASVIVLGGLLVASQVFRGSPPSPPLVAGVAAVVGGLYLAWTYLDQLELNRSGRSEANGSRGRLGFWASWLIPLAGVVLVVSGALALAISSQGITFTWDVVIATAAVLTGITIVVMPWGVRAWRRLVAEQETRIRETERADIAAHLHDSVLQTLALIQRTDDVARVKLLARVQERELRRWLYGGAATSPESLAATITEVAHEVEEMHGVPVDLVVTGDRQLDDGTRALIRAMREALLNAVRHGEPPVSAYVEVGRRRVEAFVRDHGPGFDLDDMAEDRLGVRESIIGRMQRAGGAARIRRRDDGIEVELTLDVSDPDETGATEPTRSPGAGASEPDTPQPATSATSAPTETTKEPIP